MFLFLLQSFGLVFDNYLSNLLLACQNFSFFDDVTSLLYLNNPAFLHKYKSIVPINKNSRRYNQLIKSYQIVLNQMRVILGGLML